MTVAEWVILREMYGKSESISSSIIAELTGLTRGAVSKLVDRLVNKDLIIRTESTIDRRYHQIQLSIKGKRTGSSSLLLLMKMTKLFFSPLSEEEQKALMNILTKLSESHQLNTAPIR